jgi:hypothetical protein
MVPARIGALFALLLTATQALAQQPESDPAQDSPPAQPYTLHVYEHRMQVAALMLNPAGENVQGVTPDKVSISIDDGPRFHPAGLRVEGDDPLHLAVLIDDSDTDSELLKNFEAELPHFAATALHPEDHISLYAVDCHLIGSLNQAPATPDTVTRGLAAALTFPTLHHPNGHHCASTVALWDALASVIARMDGTSGRRVLLIVSRGVDGGSTATPDKLSELAGTRSVAIFNIRSSTAAISDSQMRGLLSAPVPGTSSAAALSKVASSNGGITFNIQPREIKPTLEHFARLLRTRYIVEFATPDSAEGGSHALAIQVPKTSGVFSTGVSWIPIDPSVKADPNTVPSAASSTVVGKKHPPPQK